MKTELACSLKHDDDAEHLDALERHHEAQAMSRLQKGFDRHLDAVAVETNRQRGIIRQALVALGAGDTEKVKELLEELEGGKP